MAQVRMFILEMMTHQKGKITKYHDFIMMNLNYEQMLYATEEECLETATEVLQKSSGAKTLTKRMF